MLIFKAEGMPPYSFVHLRGHEPGSRVGKVVLGHSGYYPTELDRLTLTEAEDVAEHVRKLNNSIGVTDLQADCMEAGSMFGWGCPGADPNWVMLNESEIYNADGSRV